MALTTREENGYRYIEEGEGEVLLLLHGLFGALSNWEGVVKAFSSRYKVIIPVIPVYDMPVKKAGVKTLADFVEDFVKFKKLNNFVILGNSLGGHVGLIYALKNKARVSGLVLTGSSGLFENAMGGSFPKRGNYDYIKERVEYTFYDPQTATTELIDDVFQITNDVPKCMRIVAIAKSAQHHNMGKEIHKLDMPTCLIWGLNDTITPPMVAHEFNRLIPASQLHFIDCCGHAPMMEHPERFNNILNDFLTQLGK